MKKHELDRAIDQQKVPSAMMLYGESHFLIEYYMRHISNLDNVNILTLYNDEYSLNTALTHLSQGSLFGGDSLLILRSSKKIPKADLERLLELVDKNPTNRFIYAYFGTDFKKGVSSAFDRSGVGGSIRLFHPYQNDAKMILISEAKRKGIELDHYVSLHLLESQNGDLALSINELDKLALSGSHIGVKDIDEIVYGTAEFKIEQLSSALVEKKKFLEILQRLLESGYDEVRILTAISSHISVLYLYNLHTRVHAHTTSMDILGYRLPPSKEQEYQKQYMRIKPYQYKKILKLLCEVELQIKSSHSNAKNTTLIATLLRVQSML